MLKKLLYFVLGLVLFVIVAVGATIAFIDPNDFKPLIIEEVKKITGRDLAIDGDISWRFWPNIGLSVGQIALSNPAGFSEKNLLQFDKAELSVAVTPLFSDRLEINQINLQDARIFVQTLADGRSNLDSLVTTPATPAPTEPEAPTESTASNWKVEIGEIDIANASVAIRDDKTKTLSEISDLDLNVGQFTTDIWVPISFSVSGKQNSIDFSTQGEGEVKLAKAVSESQLRNLSLEASMSDATSGLALKTLSLAADKMGLGVSTKLAIKAKGNNKDMAFDVNGDAKLLIDKEIKLIDISNIIVNAALTGESLPNKAIQAGFHGDVNFNNETKIINASNVALTVDEAAVTGKASVELKDIPAIRFDLSSKNINLDDFITPAKPETAAQAAGKEVDAVEKDLTLEKTEKAPLSNVEPDLSALKSLDVVGKIAIAQFQAANVKIENVKTEVVIQKGVVSLKQLNAALYGGKISANAELNTNLTPAQYRIGKSITGVNIQPLLLDAAKQKLLAGKGSITAQLQGTGLSPLALRKGIKGDIKLVLADGAIYGINIPQILREAKAAISGEKVETVQEVRKTDFSSLQAAFTLANGFASTKDMQFQSPALRIKSTGKTNLVDESMAFSIAVTVVETSKGQGANDMSDLKGLTIPVSIGGTWSNPTYGLDIKSLLSNNKALTESLRQGAEKGLDKLFGDKEETQKIKEKANDLLNKLFN